MWVDSPYQDSLDARWANVWYLFKRAAGCSLFGHKYSVNWDDFPDGAMHIRTCDRCDRKWEWEGPQPAHLAATDHDTPGAG